MKRSLWLLILLIPLLLQARTITVPTDYPTIQSAIEAAENGDIIIVEPGRYYEAINFLGKRIIIASRFLTEADPAYIENTIIDGDGREPSVVTFERQETRNSQLIGFTITGGNADMPMAPQDFHRSYGGGIYVFASEPTISDCIIRDNYAIMGGGIHFSAGAKLVNTKIINNRAQSWGGGVNAVSFGRTAEFISCLIDNNEAGGGAGINLTGEDYRFTDSTISNNRARHEGGGLYLGLSQVYFLRCLITGNTAERGAGIHISGYPGGVTPSVSHLVNCTVTANEAVSEGGGLSLKNFENVIILNSILHNNLPQSISFKEESRLGILHIAYSDIEDGETGINRRELGVVEWREGNISQDPLFKDAEAGDYRLAAGSPSIDSGTSRYTYLENVLVDKNADEYSGNAPDMGTFEREK